MGHPLGLSTKTVFVLALVFLGLMHQAKGQGVLLQWVNEYANIYDMDVTADGSTVVYGSSDNSVKVYNLLDGTLIRSLDGHYDRVHAVAITPDGSKIVSGGDDALIKIWKMSDGTLLNTVEAHDDYITSVDVTPDGTKIVSGSIDNKIKIWNLSDGSYIRTLSGHGNDVTGVVVSPDGTKVVSSSLDYTVRIWRIENGALLSTLSHTPNQVFCVAISPDGSKIVSGSKDKKLRVWSVADGTLLLNWSAHSDQISSVKISVDSSMIVSGSADGKVKVWDINDKSLVRSISAHDEVTSVGITPDGTKILSGGFDQFFKVWEMPPPITKTNAPSKSSSKTATSSITKSTSKSRTKSLSRSNSRSKSASRSMSQSKTASKSQSNSNSNSQSMSNSYSAKVKDAEWFEKNKSENFGYQVAVQQNIAAISVPFCLNPLTPNGCDGGYILTYKMDDNDEWRRHKKIKGPFRSRDNKLGWRMILNSNYLIVSAPDASYLKVDAGALVLYKWNAALDTYTRDSIIRFRNVTKNYDFGSSISNVNDVVAVGMPEFDDSDVVTHSGCAHVYKKEDSGIWGQRVSITALVQKKNDRFGQSVSLGSETILAVSNNPEATSEQAVFIFQFKVNKWRWVQTILDNTKLGFGWFVQFQGGVLHVSAVDDATDSLNAGSIQVYELGGNNKYALSYSVKPNKIVSGKHFGFSFGFSTDGSRLAVGAKPCGDGVACNIKGSVHIFTKNANKWTEYYHLESPVADGSDGYGFDVAVDGKSVLVSAPYDASSKPIGKTYFITK